ncbi:MAG: cysteine-rich CWC family protein [Solirubrobacteraceae bacterium]
MIRAPGTGRRAASCERCGGAFGCGAAEPGCWCRDVPLPDAVRRELAATYGDCLCPACIASLAAVAGEG